MTNTRLGGYEGRLKGGENMSEREKGEIVEQMANLPPDKQTLVEGFVMGLAAAAKRNESSNATSENADAENGG